MFLGDGILTQYDIRSMYTGGSPYGMMYFSDIFVIEMLNTLSFFKFCIQEVLQYISKLWIRGVKPFIFNRKENTI